MVDCCVVLSSRAGSIMKPGYLEMVDIEWVGEWTGWYIICDISEDLTMRFRRVVVRWGWCSV